MLGRASCRVGDRQRRELDAHHQMHRHRVEVAGVLVGAAQHPQPPGRQPAGLAGIEGGATPGLDHVVVPGLLVERRAAAGACSRSVTTITRHPWRLPPLGAKRALSSTRSSSSRGTGSAVKRRVDGAQRISS